MKTISMIATILAAVGLSACSSLAEKTPKQMVQSAIERSLTKDNRVNFEGEMFVKRIPTSESLLTKAQLETAANSGALKEKRASLAFRRSDYERECVYLNKEKLSKKALRALESSCAKREEVLAKEKDDDVYSDAQIDLLNRLGESLEDNPSLMDVLAGAKFRFKGAIDLPAGLFEAYSEFDYQAKHERLSFGLPVLLDINKATITADPSTMVRAVMAGVIKDKALSQRLRDEPIRIDFSEWVGKLPIKTVLKAYILSNNKAYEALPADAFQQLPQDAFGKSIGAKHRIRVVMNKENSVLFFENLRVALLEKFNELEKSEPEAGINPEEYELVRMFLSSINETDFEKLIADQDKAFANSYEMFLDNRARTLGGRVLMQPISVTKGNVMSVEGLVRYVGFDKPVFTLKSDGKAVLFSEFEAAQKARYSGLPDDAAEAVVENVDSAAIVTEAASDVAVDVVK